MNFRSVSDLNNLINKNIHLIPKDVDLVVGIPRSGMLVALLISLQLNLPLADVKELLNGQIFESGGTKNKEHWIKSIEEARKILVVEDSTFTGISIEKFKKSIEDFKYKDKIIYLSAYVTELTKNYTNLSLEVCIPPRMFEWNYFHNAGIINACFDIDGVLCVDPTEEENDDGDKYVNFIRNATPRVIPTRKIGYIVTSRLEKYRKDTEYWLKKNNIEYERLIMLNLPSKEERQKLNNHGVFKGNIYKKLTKSDIFIESNSKQAEEIAKISGKTVFCVETGEVFDERGIRKISNNVRFTIKEYIKKHLRPIKKLIKKKK